MKYEYLLGWLKRTKERIVVIFDGKCECCGYDRCISALDFHHVNQNNKDFSISQWKIKNWDKLVNELKKCVMVCSNCHREIHAGIRECPSLKERNWEYDRYGHIKLAREVRICPCGKEFEAILNSTKRFCSAVCANAPKIEWPSTEELSKMVKQYGCSHTSRLLGVTGSSVRRHLRK